jgi:nucleotide-binding universal stress UspA family protein
MIAPFSNRTDRPMYDRILIPTDGSELATRGLDHGLALAKALSLPATVITVAVPLSGFALQGIIQGEALKAYTDSVTLEITQLEIEVRQTAAKRGVTIDFVSRTDISPASAIVEAAKSSGCGLIVMSSHGRRGIVRAMLGSETAEVVAQSAIPVLVVK